MNKSVLYAEEGIEFSRDEKDQHLLSVLVGGVAQYDMTVVLTLEEVELYREFGDYYIKKLALDICHDPSSFTDRQIGSKQRTD